MEDKLDGRSKEDDRSGREVEWKIEEDDDGGEDEVGKKRRSQLADVHFGGRMKANDVEGRDKGG